MGQEVIIAGKQNPEIYQQPLSAWLGQLKKGTEVLTTITEVKDVQTSAKAVDLVNKAKTITTLITKKVDELCRPYKDAKAEIDEVQRNIKEYADKISAPLRDATKSLEGMVIRFNQIQREEAERARKIAEDMAREQAEKLRAAEKERQDKMIEAAAEGTLYEVRPPVPTMIVQTPVVVEAPKIKGMTTIWKHTIENEDLIPREYLTPDTAKINAAVKGGLREIPGIKIFSEQFIRKS